MALLRLSVPAFNYPKSVSASFCSLHRAFLCFRVLFFHFYFTVPYFTIERAFSLLCQQVLYCTLSNIAKALCVQNKQKHMYIMRFRPPYVSFTSLQLRIKIIFSSSKIEKVRTSRPTPIQLNCINTIASFIHYSKCEYSFNDAICLVCIFVWLLWWF